MVEFFAARKVFGFWQVHNHFHIISHGNNVWICMLNQSIYVYLQPTVQSEQKTKYHFISTVVCVNYINSSFFSSWLYYYTTSFCKSSILRGVQTYSFTLVSYLAGKHEMQIVNKTYQFIHLVVLFTYQFCYITHVL